MKNLIPFIAAAALLSTPSLADVLVIENATVVPVVGDPMEGSHVRIVDGRIAEVGPTADRTGADRTIDARGLFVYPGMFASITQVGLVEVSAVSAVNDEDEGTQPNTAMLRVYDAYNPNSHAIPVTRINGVTHGLVCPDAGNVFTGQGAIIEFDGKTIDETIVKAPSSLHITLGEAPKRRFDSRNQMPSTRMGLAASVRGEFEKALVYREKLRRFEESVAKYERESGEYSTLLAEWESTSEEDRDKRPKEPEEPSPIERDLTLEALVMALDGEIPTVFEAYRLDDIDTALRLSDEYGLDPILVGATSAWRIADVLAEKQVPVILAATHQPSGMQTMDAAYENAAILHEAGVPFAFMSGDRTHNLRNLPYEAGIAAAHGLDRQAALEAVTIAPARIWGLEDELGSIEPGKRANLIVTDGDPLQPLTTLSAVIIDGVETPLRSRQTELAEEWGDQYMPGAGN